MEGNEMLDRFFKGKLTEEEKLRLESLLQLDEDLREEFEFQQAAREAIVRNKHHELKSYLQEVDQELDSASKTGKILPWTPLWKIAAGIVLVLGAIFIFLKLNDSNTKSQDPDSFHRIRK